MTRQVNEAGLALIKEFEGCRLTAYLCPAGVPTIGYGATGQDIRLGMIWTQEQADERLAEDVAQFAGMVDEVIQVDCSDNEFSAMVSLAFNIGGRAFRNSTLARLVNEGNFAGAAKQFARWNKAGGRELAGLTRRREAERDLFLTPGNG